MPIRISDEAPLGVGQFVRYYNYRLECTRKQIDHLTALFVNGF